MLSASSDTKRRAPHERVRSTSWLSMPARFWPKVERAGRSARDCWLWTGRLRNGYGAIMLNGRWVGAHRVAFALHRSIPLPDRSTLVRHTCDNPPCCNPRHLRPGTHQDNQRDAVRRGRHWWQKRTTAVCGHPFNAMTSHGRRECRECAAAKRRAYDRAHPEVRRRAKQNYRLRHGGGL